MWPYTDDEASWLRPPDPAKRTVRRSANDNDPAKRVPPRPAQNAPAPARKFPRKSKDET
jgi:hypothetical protein